MFCWIKLEEQYKSSDVEQQPLFCYRKWYKTLKKREEYKTKEDTIEFWQVIMKGAPDGITFTAHLLNFFVRTVTWILYKI